MMIATVAWLLFSAAYVLRTRRMIHIALANSAILLDVALVLQLQVSRGAVQTAASFSLAVLPQIHILMSLIALLLYFPVLWLGWKMVLRGPCARTKLIHIKLAMAAYLFRTLGFAFMFSMWRF